MEDDASIRYGSPEIYKNLDLLKKVRELNPDANAEETRKIGQFFAGAMMGILIPWVLSGMKNNALSNVSELSIPVFNREIMQKLLRGDPQ